MSRRSLFPECPTCGYVYDADDESRVANHAWHHEDTVVRLRLGAVERNTFVSLQGGAPADAAVRVAVVPPDALRLVRKIGSAWPSSRRGTLSELLRV